jgi:Uma2 family endonuclease
MSTAALSETTPVWAFEPGTPLSQACPGNHFPETVAEVWLRAGKVPLDRILMEPAPGTATSDDAVYSKERLDLNCELVNGILVAKTMGYFESKVAAALIYFFHQYLESHPIGEVAGGDGSCDTVDDNVRKPDVSFTSFDRIRKQGKATRTKLPFPPDLAVEVLSPSNTPYEMDTKLSEYFAGGARLVWYIESELKTARVFAAIDQHEDIPVDGALRGGDVLPAFELPLVKLFEKAGPRRDE